MNEPNVEHIRKYLQTREAQERIQKRMQDARSKATVTISRAAALFGFSESKLREWEKRGWLKTDRPTLSQDSKTSTGHRQYSPDELDKLALMRELMDQNYGLNEIPQNIDVIWKQILDEQQGQVAIKEAQDGRHAGTNEHLPIDKRIERSNKELFWRYYAPQVLRLSLKLICADTPDTITALILPLSGRSASSLVPHSDELPTIGESLIGWLDLHSSISVLFDPTPSFEVPSDFRLLALQPMKEDAPEEHIPPKDGTLIAVQRKAMPLTLSKQAVEVIQRLLASLYEREDWQTYFGKGMRDITYPGMDFDNPLVVSERVLTGFTNQIVQLGGKMANGQPRWRFCCILLPKDHLRPFQMRNLVVHAQSENSPHTVGSTKVSPKINLNSLTLRAYQSGRIVYRSFISPIDPMIAHREVEAGINSAIAVPIGAENGQTVAVLYVASGESDAFTENDQRLLRVVGRMIEELILTYHARVDVAKKLIDLIKVPDVVDTLFADFLSENTFFKDVDELLCDVQTGIQQKDRSSTSSAMPITAEPAIEEVVSFLAIDANRLSDIGITYGDQATRNLSRAIGKRIEGQFRALFTPYPNCRLYHIYAGRFYLMLKGVALEVARNQAERLRQALRDPYHIDALRTTIEESTRSINMVEMPNVTVRIVVTSYPFSKLEDFLRRPQYSAINDVIARIINSLEEGLKVARDEGRDVVIAWDPDSNMFKRWSPVKGE